VPEGALAEMTALLMIEPRLLYVARMALPKLDVVVMVPLLVSVPTVEFITSMAPVVFTEALVTVTPASTVQLPEVQAGFAVELETIGHDVLDCARASGNHTASAAFTASAETFNVCLLFDGCLPRRPSIEAISPPEGRVKSAGII
jgi:hypothetical protein